MIAEAPESTAPTLTLASSRDESASAEQPFTAGRVTGMLQLLLVLRRAERNADHAYWCAISRGL